MFKWLRYSGASVILTLNPLHWYLKPRYRVSQEWGDEGTYMLSWLFFTIRIWIDDGSW
jgi:hypothetical protein